MLLDTGGDSENVRIENDVLRWESDFPGEDAVGARTDLDFAFDGVRLSLLVESHNDYGRAEPSNLASVFRENLFAFLEADRIDDAFALNALQSRLDHGPPGAVDHDRNPRDVRFGSDQI